MTEEVQRHSVHTLVFRSLKRTHDMFISNQGTLPPIDESAEKLKRLVKARDGYSLVFDKVKQNKTMKKLQSDMLENSENALDRGFVASPVTFSTVLIENVTGKATKP